MSPKLPYEAYAIALAELPEMGPARLLAAHGHGDLRRLWFRIADQDPQIFGLLIEVARGAGRASDRSLEPIVRGWYRAAAARSVEDRWAAFESSGYGVAVFGSDSYPAALADDPDPPIVLWYAGDLDALAGTRVALVGTRTCSRYGRDLAAEWGHQLSRAGIAVVSGLAAGVDAAAHAGAVRGGAPPIAVVGSGLDVVYPRANGALWQMVCETGVVLSESPLGAPPDAWRFPARNRIIAALSDVVVVIESHEHGGSLITARDALARDKPVMAVPGPVRSAASAGTNQLLRDGAMVATSIDDVLAVVGLVGTTRPAAETRPAPSPAGRRLLDALGWLPATADQLAASSALDLATMALELDELVETRWLARRGGWYERISRDRV